jgi:hypothetical protein
VAVPAAVAAMLLVAATLLVARFERMFGRSLRHSIRRSPTTRRRWQ